MGCDGCLAIMITSLLVFKTSLILCRHCKQTLGQFLKQCARRTLREVSGTCFGPSPRPVGARRQCCSARILMSRSRNSPAPPRGAVHANRFRCGGRGPPRAVGSELFRSAIRIDDESTAERLQSQSHTGAFSLSIENRLSMESGKAPNEPARGPGESAPAANAA